MNAASRTGLFLLAACLAGTAQPPQAGRGPAPAPAPGVLLDLEGKTKEARELFQKDIDGAATPLAKAQAERNMAMSWAFEGNCKKTAEYEDKVIAYWKTREAEDPGNAFFQQGEMANEGARVCIDLGDLKTAAALYKRGHDVGLKEPNIAPARKDLWEFRYEHALARLAARRGSAAEARKHVKAAEAALEDMKDKDPQLYKAQSGFVPYLTGYVAFYAGDYKSALADFEKDSRNDAFVLCMIGMTYEKLGDRAKAMDAYKRASATRGHNPPAAFAVPFTRKKLGA